jgi:hypothetical protein
MIRAHQVYESLAECLNLFDDLTTQEVAHISCLIAAQLPHAAPGVVAAFQHADQTEMEEMGSPLLRLRAGIEPGSSGQRETTVETTHAVSPEEGEPIPVVTAKRQGDAYLLDKHSTILMCKFHEQRFPTPEDFDAQDARTFLINISYGHVSGGFSLRIHRPGWSAMTLAGEFTIESFIPVRVVVE